MAYIAGKKEKENLSRQSSSVQKFYVVVVVVVVVDDFLLLLFGGECDWLRKWMAHVCPHDLRLGVPQCCFRHRQKGSTPPKSLKEERKRNTKHEEQNELTC